MNNDLYYQYNPWWEESYEVPHFISRPLLEKKLIESLPKRQIVLLTGLRRVGKTTLLKYLIQYLLTQKISSKHIFYISCDDYLLRDASILDMVNHFRAIHRIPVRHKIYIFFDEITYKTDFRIQLKNLYDKENIKIFASSSSSSALRDKRGYLTGREQIIEITPLSFSEFLNFKNITIKKRDEKLLPSYFEDYMEIGGMPEYVLNDDREYLTALVDNIIYKDIVAFHNIRNPHIIADYFMLLMERSGKQISLNKIAKILSISPDTANRYLQLFADTFLIYLMPRYGKTNETLLSPQKIYAADVGIRNHYIGFRDKGAIFENLIFNAIKSRNPRYVYRDGIEIDFITKDQTLIEVKYNRDELNDKQQKLFDEFPAKEKIIIKDFYDYKKLVENI